MFLFIIFYFVAVVLWIISISFNDIEDALQYYYKDSIFDWIPKDSWWSWYLMDPDNTWKRKYIYDDKDNIVGRRKLLGFFSTPAFMYDGWHGAKIIRQNIQYMTFFFGILCGYVLVTMTISYWFLLFVIGLVIFGVTNYLTHEVYVFKGVLTKVWWQKRGEEEKIKKILDKWF